MWRLATTHQKLRPTVVLAIFSGCTTTATGGGVSWCDNNNNHHNDGGKTSGAGASGDNQEFWNSLLHKSSKGSIGWDQVRQDMGEGLFWDKLAKQAGYKIQSAINTGIPTTISYGFVSGFCSGYALKKVGKVVAVVLGLGFLGVQTLANMGYINVDHTRIGNDFNKAMDLNNDGVVDEKDAAAAYEYTLKKLTLNLPAGGGFAAGFVGGLRSG